MDELVVNRLALHVGSYGSQYVDVAVPVAVAERPRLRKGDLARDFGTPEPGALGQRGGLAGLQQLPLGGLAHGHTVHLGRIDAARLDLATQKERGDDVDAREHDRLGE